MLWTRLSETLGNHRGVNCRVCGDSNSIHFEEERKGGGTTYCQEDFEHYNRFIDDNLLFALPFCAKSFTWYRGDDMSMICLN